MNRSRWKFGINIFYRWRTRNLLLWINRRSQTYVPWLSAKPAQNSQISVILNAGNQKQLCLALWSKQNKFKNTFANSLTSWSNITWVWVFSPFEDLWPIRNARTRASHGACDPWHWAHLMSWPISCSRHAHWLRKSVISSITFSKCTKFFNNC